MTTFSISTALRSRDDYPADGLTVEIKYCPRFGRHISGTYYRRTTTSENGVDTPE